MAVTIIQRKTDEQVLRQWMFEWEVEFSVDNDACQIDIGGADPHIGVIWQRVHTDVAVTFTVERETFAANPAVTTGWQAHPATGLMAWEQAPACRTQVQTHRNKRYEGIYTYSYGTSSCCGSWGVRK